MIFNKGSETSQWGKNNICNNYNKMNLALHLKSCRKIAQPISILKITEMCTFYG